MQAQKKKPVPVPAAKKPAARSAQPNRSRRGKPESEEEEAESIENDEDNEEDEAEEDAEESEEVLPVSNRRRDVKQAQKKNQQMQKANNPR